MTTPDQPAVRYKDLTTSQMGAVEAAMKAVDKYGSVCWDYAAADEGDDPDTTPAWNDAREALVQLLALGVAEGRRQATEQIVEAIKAAARLAWTKSHWTGLNAAAEIASRLVGPWEPASCPTCSGPIRETVGMVCQICGTDYAPAEQATPSCTCPMLDVTNVRAGEAPGSETVKGYSANCPVCPNQYAKAEQAEGGAR